ncbi:MAG: tetratricopeptide repeat protein [Novosphingobium sp.]|nr:tetratricopeptide repeat protein [Novosphingobium sp.]
MLLLPLLLMVGSLTDPGNPAPVSIKPLPIPRRGTVLRRTDTANAPPAPVARDRLGICLSAVKDDPMTGLASARAWAASATAGTEAGRANQCLGTAQARAGHYAEALPAFTRAIAALPAGEEGRHAALYALAAQSALASGDATRALGWLQTALLPSSVLDADAKAEAQCDRARALVTLGRPEEARTALAEAHRLAPESAESWLLSATLARRDKNLVLAQHDIELAAQYARLDPAVGLEAGVIAVLAGRDDAARKSWQSVLTAAPDSAEAVTAKGYLAQLGGTIATPQPAPAKATGR